MFEHDPEIRNVILDRQRSLRGASSAGLAVSSTRSAWATSLSPSMNAGFSDLLRDIPSPQIALPDAAEQRVLVIAAEVFCELRFVGLEVADDADDDRIPLGDVEHPEVVFDPGTCLDFDGADGAKRGRELAIPIRIRRDRRLSRRRWAPNKAHPAAASDRTDVCACR